MADKAAKQRKAKSTAAKSSAAKAASAKSMTMKAASAKSMTMKAASAKSTITKASSAKSTTAKASSAKSTTAKASSAKSSTKSSAARPTARAAKEAGGSRAAAKPILLAGGNPQIAKGDGDAPVQAYLDAMPGWKGDVGRRLDALIVRTVPGVRKAVRWNSPFYGAGAKGWFLGFHCLSKSVKVAFFRGASLRPSPPGESKNADTRYLDLREDDALDEELVASWIRQAAALPGWGKN